MEQQDNTGLGLIGATIERVRNDKSLFSSALKKLVNLPEEDLVKFLDSNYGKPPNPEKLWQKEHRNLVYPSNSHKNFSLKALDGRTTIGMSKDFFKYYVDSKFSLPDFNLSTVATPNTLLWGYLMKTSEHIFDTLRALPGDWEKKWLSQNQVLEFCRKYSFPSVMFLCKMDEQKPVNEDYPGKNLFKVIVTQRGNASNGRSVDAWEFDQGSVWQMNSSSLIITRKKFV